MGSVPQKQPGYMGWQSQRGATTVGALLGIWGFAVPSTELGRGRGEDQWPGDTGTIMEGLEGAQHPSSMPGVSRELGVGNTEQCALCKGLDAPLSPEAPLMAASCPAVPLPACLPAPSREGPAGQGAAAAPPLR